MDGLTEWTVSTTACYDTSTTCAEDPAGLIAELSTMPEADAATLAADATCLDIVAELDDSTELDCNSLLPSGQSLNSYCTLACGKCTNYLQPLELEAIRSNDFVLDVYVIPGYFYESNGAGVFEPITSTVTGQTQIVAGETFTLTIVTKDEFENALTASVPDIAMEDLFELHAPSVLDWVYEDLQTGEYTVATTWEASGEYLVHMLGAEPSGMGFVAMSGSPWSLTVVPDVLDFTTSYCTGAGSGIAHHGLPSEIDGNRIEFHAMDRFSNPRLTGTDALAINFLSSSAVIDAVVAGENGVYTFNYWWQYATFNQHIIF